MAKGFELAQEDLIRAAETGGRRADLGWNAFTSELERSHSTVEYSESDHEDSS